MLFAIRYKLNKVQLHSSEIIKWHTVNYYVKWMIPGILQRMFIKKGKNSKLKLENKLKSIGCTNLRLKTADIIKYKINVDLCELKIEFLSELCIEKGISKLNFKRKLAKLSF